ncbi:MAG: MBOAT family protein [Alphaproteobacteria bacterium]|nr:MBOAT family protein [Alphaproteobacteria bacterium]
MLFTDRAFFALLFCTFAAYYLRRSAGYQIAVLLIASLLFYAWSQPWLLILLGFSALLSTVTSYEIEREQDDRARRAWAIGGVAVNLTVLAFFKYDRLVYASLVGSQPAGGFLGTLLGVPLPIGISFYTFHGISLVVDVFRARRSGETQSPLKQERGFLDRARRTFFYLTFFPQLIAGPIVKARDFYPQMGGKLFADIHWYGVAKALIIGFFLKSVVADNLAQQTTVLAPPFCYSQSTLNLVFVLVAYSIQIFSDFAGYSLIAIGLARLFGYALPDNFRFPYIAQSFSEFWTRWHMSLSAWLRDYVYYPLGGNRKGPRRTYVNLLLVMTLGGLWHGAGWSYALWGLWHGSALALERMARGTRVYLSEARIAKAARWALVFGVVTLGWTLFKLPDFHQVRELAGAAWNNRHLRFSRGVPIMLTLYIAPVVLYHVLYQFRDRPPRRLAFLWSMRAEGVALGVMLTAIVLQAGNPAPFIYFQF